MDINDPKLLKRLGRELQRLAETGAVVAEVNREMGTRDYTLGSGSRVRLADSNTRTTVKIEIIGRLDLDTPTTEEVIAALPDGDLDRLAWTLRDQLVAFDAELERRAQTRAKETL